MTGMGWAVEVVAWVGQSLVMADPEELPDDEEAPEVPPDDEETPLELADDEEAPEEEPPDADPSRSGPGALVEGALEELEQPPITSSSQNERPTTVLSDRTWKKEL
jgi:hypothetical protein